MGDVPDLKRAFRDPRTARAAGAPLQSTEERRDPRLMVRRTLREYRAGSHLSVSAIHRESGRCIGRVGLRELDWTYRKVGTISYWIDPGYWNRGLATEAAWFLCDGAFRHLGMRRVSSQSLDRNEASIAVHRKLGFVEEGRERRSVCIGGRCMDMVLFGLFPRELTPWGKILESIPKTDSRS
jgi:ribosomal-protein-alanine N-acetyltransferase